MMSRFIRRFLVIHIAAALCLLAVSAHAVTIDMVTVGNSGNANDTSGYGAVNYEYQIGKYDVTIGQYTDFLNAVAKTNDRGLWNAQMSSDQRIRGIQQRGSEGSFVYTVVGPNGFKPAGATSAANRPITFVSWFDAARFANWMANGQPTGAAGPTTTDNGAYDLGTATSGNAPAKNTTDPNTGAAPTFYIPTENEWYKAAYYSPVKGGPSTPGYFLYGTGYDATPGKGWNAFTALSVKHFANQANYRIGSLYAVTGSTITIESYSNQNLLTDVGAYTNSYSYYGAFDMSGNAGNWNDLDGTPGSFRGNRGGSWVNNSAIILSSAERETLFPATENFGRIGFRLASPVPEPSTYAMALAGLACGGYLRFRRRKRAAA